MTKLGNAKIAGLCLGAQKIKTAYLGGALVFDAAPAPTVYTITVTIDPAGSGAVTGGGQYGEGESVTLTATAADGYALSKWQIGGEDVGTGDSYTFTATGNVEVTAIFKESRLPAGYAELQYIESDNHCCIDVGLNLGDWSNRRIILDLQANSFTSGAEYICSYKWPSTSQRWYLTRQDGGSFIIRVGSATNNLSNPNIAGSRANFEWSQYGKILKIGSVSKSITLGGSGSYSGNICIFSPGSTYGLTGISAKLYSAKIYNSNTLQRDLVPCKNPSGVVGLFDLIGKGFYSNSGTGTLTAGPTV